MKRIKYVKTPTEGIYITEGYIQTYTKGPVIGSFDEKELTFKITSPLGTETIIQGTATSRHKLLLKLKKAYIQLGAKDLETETRVERVGKSNE